MTRVSSERPAPISQYHQSRSKGTVPRARLIRETSGSRRVDDSRRSPGARSRPLVRAANIPRAHAIPQTTTLPARAPFRDSETSPCREASSVDAGVPEVTLMKRAKR